jgi:hypothetical protein
MTDNSLERDRFIDHHLAGQNKRVRGRLWGISKGHRGQSAAREEEEEQEEANKPKVGFEFTNATVTVATDSLTVAVITDSSGESMDICMSQAVAITDSGGKASGWYKQPVSRVDSINGNNRLYPRSVYQPTLDALNQAGYPYAGEHPHPLSAYTILHDVLSAPFISIMNASYFFLKYIKQIKLIVFAYKQSTSLCLKDFF